MLASGIIKYVPVFVNQVSCIIVCTALLFHISKEDFKTILNEQMHHPREIQIKQKVINHSNKTKSS